MSVELLSKIDDAYDAHRVNHRFPPTYCYMNQATRDRLGEYPGAEGPMTVDRIDAHLWSVYVATDNALADEVFDFR